MDDHDFNLDVNDDDHEACDQNMLQDHIMFTMGDDFQYQNAVMNYKNMDKVFFLIIKNCNNEYLWII